MLKSLLFAMIGLFTFSQVQAEERVVATVNGTPILQSQVNAVMGKKGSQRAALDKIIDDMLTEKAIKESGVKVNQAEVNRIVETTPQGTISAPFKSEFGWHILEVTGSRDGDKTEDAYRQKAYEQIVNSQLQDATKDWVKALRKNADIQYFDK